MNSSRGTRLLLQDILEAIAEIQKYTPRDRAAFDSDPPLRSHLLRQLMIVGEASWRLPKPLKAGRPEVPWRRIEGMRHVLVHDYFRVDWDVVYSTVCDHVPPLKDQIEAILAAIPPDEKPTP